MLNSAHEQTVISIRKLKREFASGRPIVWWIGAGASRWAGYESWKELGRRMRSHFQRFHAGFDASKARELLHKGDYPSVFELCKKANPHEYYRFLSEAFRPKAHPPAYSRFLSKLRAVRSAYILTTNVDEELERNLQNTILLQTTDVSRLGNELLKRQPFIAKLHGSISFIESIIFATSDYSSLVANISYIQALGGVFRDASVVFLGYGVRDEYVLKLLGSNASEQRIFGAGPHFVVKAPGQETPPELHPIEYQVDRLSDHSAAVTVIDLYLQLQDASPTSETPERKSAFEEARKETAYFLSDFMPAGTWITSQTAEAQSAGGQTIEVKVGLGYTNDEVPFRISTALHDLLVGLLCFDYVYLPLNALGQIFESLGEERVRRLLEEDAVKLIDVATDLGAVFTKGEMIGSLADTMLQDPTATGPRTVNEKICKILTPVSGKEADAERLLQLVESRVTVWAGNGSSVASMTRDALLMPQIPKLLGIGDAITPGQLPRWLAFPYLRLGHLVQTAVVCRDMKIQAAKLPFGGQALTSAAFGLESNTTTADEIASYVLSGRYNTDIGVFVVQQPSVIDRVLQFRSTESSGRLRSEVRSALLSDAAAEFTASVNGALVGAIPIQVLERARDGMSALFVESSRLTTTPAVWTNEWQSDRVTQYWRHKSRVMFLDLCRERGIGNDDPCICGSGDRMRDCCLPPLRT